MNIFELIVVQPVFNVLALIYGLIPLADFGVAVIVFTIIIRLAMWPLVKKQLHQTKLMRKLQPELKKIKAKAKGNRQLESQLMMELYREKGVNPFSSFGLLILQLPVYIALYQVINMVTHDKHAFGNMTYSFLQGLPQVHNVIANPNHFSENLFGFINLSKHAIEGGSVYWPIFLLAIFAAGLQYIQSKQVAPEVTEKRKLRDILKEQAGGKQVDQSEVSAQVTNKMLFLFPILTLFIALYLPGALVVYFVTSSLTAVIQQHFALRGDVEEMEKIADTPNKKRAQKAQEAEVVAQPEQVKAAKKKRKKKK